MFFEVSLLEYVDIPLNLILGYFSIEEDIKFIAPTHPAISPAY